jgi:DNA polymerase-3 subunit epsilon
MKRRWLKLRRYRTGRRKLEEPYSEFVHHSLPSARAVFRDTEFVSLDIETTGLDAATADMLSVGWVLIRDGKVDLATAESHIVRHSSGVGDSAAVHGLTDTIVESGVDWAVVLDKIIAALTGRVLLVHHAGLDKLLLDRFCKRRYGAPLLVPVVDTLALEQRRQQRRHHIDEQKSLRLAELRSRYQLPRYNAHDCLVDAIATAELLIAMVAHNGGAASTRLRDLCS